MSDQHPPDPPPEPGAWKAAFLAALEKVPNVSAAAKAAGVNRQYCYEARKADPDFAIAWDDTLEATVDALEAEVFRRAHKGTRKPVFYKGSQCGHVREFSDSLAMFLLKAHRASKYRDKVSTEHSGEVKVILEYETADPPYAHIAPPGPEGPG